MLESPTHALRLWSKVMAKSRATHLTLVFNLTLLMRSLTFNLTLLMRLLVVYHLIIIGGFD